MVAITADQLMAMQCGRTLLWLELPTSGQARGGDQAWTCSPDGRKGTQWLVWARRDANANERAAPSTLSWCLLQCDLFVMGTDGDSLKCQFETASS